MLCIVNYASPIGNLQIAFDDEWIYEVLFREDAEPQNTTKLPKHILTLQRELDNYFTKPSNFSHVFTLVHLKPNGTNFQLKVWDELGKIPYGTTTSYQNIADKTNTKNGSRAVGLANGSNPIAIVLPCHRVIGSSGKLTGYAGGLWRKEWLLKHEGAMLI